MTPAVPGCHLNAAVLYAFFRFASETPASTYVRMVNFCDYFYKSSHVLTPNKSYSLLSLAMMSPEGCEEAPEVENCKVEFRQELPSCEK